MPRPAALWKSPFLAAGVALILMSTVHAAETGRKLERFSSGGKEIRIETFAPADSRQLSSIIVLHGATGVEFANRFIAGIATQFAAQGFVVHLVHYFDRTGATYADDETIRRSSAHWLKTVDDAVAYIHEQRPHASIGLFGYSLGGYLAAAAGISNPHVSAAVILAGGLDEGSAQAPRHAPPMLILHGSTDTRVPVSEARRLEAALKKAGRAPEVHIYPGEGHLMQLATYADVVHRGATFFQQQLTLHSLKSAH